MRLELGEDVGEPFVGDFHLVERLGGGEPGGGAAVGLADPRRRPLDAAQAAPRAPTRRLCRRVGIGALLGLGERTRR